MTESAKLIHYELLRSVDRFKVVSYDMIHVDAKGFDEVFYAFQSSIKELEKCLGTVVCLAFDDCSTFYGRFKLSDSFEGLLDRPVVQYALEKKYVSLVQAYTQDLKQFQDIFLRSRDAPLIANNLPPIARTLYWCLGLVERIQMMMKLNQLGRSILEREETKEELKGLKQQRKLQKK